VTAARFRVGDAVRARAERHGGHMRLPRYLCGRRGTVESVHGVVPLADERAHGGERGKGAPLVVLYTVVFDGREVWGDEAAGALSIAADLWETYLDEPEASR